MGGVRQQFSTPAEVALARASMPLFRELGAPLFDPVGYLFVATSEEGLGPARGARRAAARARRARRGRRRAAGARPACRRRPRRGRLPRGRRRRARRRSRASSSAARPSSAWRCAKHTTRATSPHDVLVVAQRAASAEVAPELPVRPLCRQLVDVGPVDGLPADLPMVVEEETGFHFRRRGRHASARHARARAALGPGRGRGRGDRR